MKSKFKPLLIAVMMLISLSACAPKADYDIRGTWGYTMTSLDGNQYDNGTVTFDGSDTKGHYKQINIYDVEYIGDYKVSGSDITLTGYENWQGTFNSENALSGSWNHEDGTKGTFTAVKE